MKEMKLQRAKQHNVRGCKIPLEKICACVCARACRQRTISAINLSPANLIGHNHISLHAALLLLTMNPGLSVTCTI